MNVQRSCSVVATRLLSEKLKYRDIGSASTVQHSTAWSNNTIAQRVSTFLPPYRPLPASVIIESGCLEEICFTLTSRCCSCSLHSMRDVTVTPFHVTEPIHCMKTDNYSLYITIIAPIRGLLQPTGRLVYSSARTHT